MFDHLETIEQNVLKLQAEEQKERGGDDPAAVKVYNPLSRQEERA